MVNLDFKSLLDLHKAFPTEQSCIDYLTASRWSEELYSPFDRTSKVYVCANNKYVCKNTGKYFNVKTGTLFDNTKIGLRSWFMAIYLITQHKKGISSAQLARDINVTQKTAWFMSHRIRNCFGMIPPDELDNDVQMDETFVGGKNKNRHADKKVKQSQGRSFKDKTPVLGLLSNGKVEAYVIPNTQAEHIKPIIMRRVKAKTTIITDEWTAYRGLNRYYNHYIVDHARREYVNEAGYTTNAIEGFWSIVKRGIIGIYHFTSRKHLQKYMNEFAFRYNTSLDNTAFRFNLMLSNMENRLTYKMLIQ